MLPAGEPDPESFWQRVYGDSVGTLPRLSLGTHFNDKLSGVHAGEFCSLFTHKERSGMAHSRKIGTCLISASVLAFVAGAAIGQEEKEEEKKPDFPKFEEVSKDFVKVVSTADGAKSLYTVWTREKDGQMLAELPSNFATQKQWFAVTVGSGEIFAGLQGRNLYTYWKRYDKRIALMAPEINTRSTGDQESKDSVERIFTDRVILDIPIVCIGPGGQPVIDLDGLLAGNAETFFGYSARGANTNLLTITSAKAFPNNIEIAIEMPVAGGTLKEFHYSISAVEGSAGYEPRKADQRLGYFTTTYRDLGKFEDGEKIVRYINRWNIEKRDPSLKLSPPKQPLVFYIDHTVPVRYRRFVRDGVEYWNSAFERVGILNAIEVYQQDSATGAHMDKDPEDIRYNFIRWLSNDIGTAIGPSRAHPETGEILDADVILTDGWIRYFNYQFNDLLPETAMEGMSPETLAWLATRPEYDPRVLLADPAQREFKIAEIAQRGIQRYGGHPAALVDDTLYGDDEYDGQLNQQSEFNGMCLASRGKGLDVALMGMHLDVARELLDEEADDENSDMLDGMPDWFIGPMLADLVAHEVGHTLGLRHNFKASSQYTMAEINSEEVKGRAFTASVMDYNPININMDSGEIQGDYAMIALGDYDYWVIDYGYGENPEETVKLAAEKNIPYATDYDTWGIDPLARRYDFAAWPLDYCENQNRLIALYRDRLMDKFVEEGDSWSRATRGYNITLNQQMSGISVMANWIGGAHIYRDKKGDPDARPPLVVVDAEKQRAALKFVIENGFRDEAFGLDPEIITHLTADNWSDRWGIYFADPAFPIHDRVSGIMNTSLTMIMNPTTLKNVYDNEFRVASDEDAITLPEVMSAVIGEVFSEIAQAPKQTFTERQPMISSFRRNLQSGLVDRLIDFTRPGTMSGSAAAPVRALSSQYLTELQKQIDTTLEHNGKLDDYTKAHLASASSRIGKALDATFIYNTDDF